MTAFMRFDRVLPQRPCLIEKGAMNRVLRTTYGSRNVDRPLTDALYSRPSPVDSDHRTQTNVFYASPAITTRPMALAPIRAAGLLESSRAAARVAGSVVCRNGQRAGQLRRLSRQSQFSRGDANRSHAADQLTVRQGSLAGPL